MVCAPSPMQILCKYSTNPNINSRFKLLGLMEFAYMGCDSARNALNLFKAIAITLISFF